jgi:hypothetical protein
MYIICVEKCYKRNHTFVLVYFEINNLITRYLYCLPENYFKEKW